MRRKSRRNTLRLGDSNAIDDISGFKHKRSQMKTLGGTQRGLLTLASDYNAPHPQLEIRSREENTTVEDSRIRTTDSFPTPPTQDDL